MQITLVSNDDFATVHPSVNYDFATVHADGNKGMPD
jgi:hypothetical protein